MNRMGIAVLFTVTFLCLLSSFAFAVTWANVYDLPADNWGAERIQSTSDGGFIVAGDTPDRNVWLVKLTSTGSVSWQVIYGGAASEYVQSVRQTSDGGYVVAAVTLSYGSGDFDAWVFKLNSFGKILWQKAYGGSGRDWISTIQQTTDGGFIFAGRTYSFSHPDGDAWVVKTDSAGTIVWRRTFGQPNRLDWIEDIHQTFEGGFICTGVLAGGYAWVMKLSTAGHIAWQRSYGPNYFVRADRVQQTSDGSFVVAGITSSSGAGGVDFWVFKLDPFGTMLWQKTYGGPDQDRLYQLEYTFDDGYIVTGTTNPFDPDENALVLKLDSSGGILWQKTYGGGSAWDIQQTSDGGYILAGRTFGFGATPPSDAWVLRLDSNGDIGTDCSIINSSSAVALEATAVETFLAVTFQSPQVITKRTTAGPANFSTTIMQLCP